MKGRDPENSNERRKTDERWEEEDKSGRKDEKWRKTRFFWFFSDFSDHVTDHLMDHVRTPSRKIDDAFDSFSGEVCEPDF